MKLKSVWALALSVAMVATQASAQIWNGPDLTRRPSAFGQGDLDFILAELCFPVIVQGADPAEIVRTRRLPAAFGRRDWNGGEPIYLVGQGDVMVGFNATMAGVTTCTLRITGGDVERYREALDARLATFPVPLTPAPMQAAPNTYAERRTYCGPAEGPQYMVLASFGAPAVRVMVTVARFDERQPVCDAPP